MGYDLYINDAHGDDLVYMQWGFAGSGLQDWVAANVHRGAYTCWGKEFNDDSKNWELHTFLGKLPNCQNVPMELREKLLKLVIDYHPQILNLKESNFIFSDQEVEKWKKRGDLPQDYQPRLYESQSYGRSSRNIILENLIKQELALPDEFPLTWKRYYVSVESVNPYGDRYTTTHYVKWWDEFVSAVVLMQTPELDVIVWY